MENGNRAILLSIVPEEPNEVTRVQNAANNARGKGVLYIGIDSPIGDYFDATIKTISGVLFRKDIGRMSLILARSRD